METERILGQANPKTTSKDSEEAVDISHAVAKNRLALSLKPRYDNMIMTLK